MILDSLTFKRFWIFVLCILQRFQLQLSTANVGLSILLIALLNILQTGNDIKSVSRVYV